MHPAILYANYVVQLISSIGTIILNPYTLYRQLRSCNGSAQLSMIIAHMVIHFFFGLTTLIHSFYMCVIIEGCDPNRNHEIIFWTGNLDYSTLYAAGMVDLFLAFDRFFAITYPVKYFVSFKNSFLVLSVVTCILYVLVGVVLLPTARAPPSPDAIIFSQHLNTNMLLVFTFSNTVFIILNVAVTVVVIVKMRKFHRELKSKTVAVAGSKRDLIKANMIVLYQLILETLFCILPFLANSIIKAGYGVTTTWILGPYVMTLPQVYICLCSILYFVKLSKSQSGGRRRSSAVVNVSALNTKWS